MLWACQWLFFSHSHGTLSSTHSIYKLRSISWIMFMSLWLTDSLSAPGPGWLLYMPATSHGSLGYHSWNCALIWVLFSLSIPHPGPSFQFVQEEKFHFGRNNFCKPQVTCRKRSPVSLLLLLAAHLSDVDVVKKWINNRWSTKTTREAFWQIFYQDCTWRCWGSQVYPRTAQKNKKGLKPWAFSLFPVNVTGRPSSQPYLRLSCFFDWASTSQLSSLLCRYWFKSQIPLLNSKSVTFLSCVSRRCWFYLIYACSKAQLQSLYLQHAVLQFIFISFLLVERHFSKTWKGCFAIAMISAFAFSRLFSCINPCCDRKSALKFPLCLV